MKVYIGPYKNWYGPYQLVEMIFFWQEKYPEDGKENRFDYKLSDKLGDFLSKTWINTLCEKIHKFRGDRKIKIKLHKYDAWNVDGTLAPIILPLLKDLKKIKHGSGYIDFEDVPEYMRTTNTEEYDHQKTFDFYRLENEESLKYSLHDRFNYVLDEMIWAFEQLQPDFDWEDQYWKHRPVLDLEKYPEDEGKLAIPVRFKQEGECDWEGRQKHQDRISNGLRLFGKYYQTLWD